MRCSGAFPLAMISTLSAPHLDCFLTFYSDVLCWHAHPITIKIMLRVYHVMAPWAGLTWSQQQDAHNQSYLSVHTFSLWSSRSKVVTWFCSASLEASASDLSLLFSSSWFSSRCLCAWQKRKKCNSTCSQLQCHYAAIATIHMQLWYGTHTPKVDFSCVHSSVSLVTSSSRRRFSVNRWRQKCSKLNSYILDLFYLTV